MSKWIGMKESMDEHEDSANEITFTSSCIRYLQSLLESMP